MTEKSLVYNEDSKTFDYQYNSKGDAETDNLETQIYLALFSNSRADKSEVPRVELRNGFWGAVFGDEGGSKIWLNNGRKTNENLNRIVDYAKNSLKFLVESGKLKRINVDGNFIENGVELNIRITYLDNNTKNIKIEV